MHLKISMFSLLLSINQMKSAFYLMIIHVSNLTNNWHWKSMLYLSIRKVNQHSCYRIVCPCISLLALALFLPVPAIVVILTSKEYEFVSLTYPPTLCLSKDVDVVYYSIIFIMNIILFIGIPMLLYSLWILHKVCEIYKEGGTLNDICH